MKPIATILLVALLASCGGAGAPEIAVRDAWARPTITAAQPGAIYLRIVNSGDAADRLQSVASGSGRASLHNSVVENRVVRMRPVTGGLVVAGGSTLELKPHAMHIMIEGLREPLKSGARLPLTLRFEKAGDRKVEVQVAHGPTESHEGH